MKTKEVRMKYIEIKNFFDFLNKIANERGVSKEVTACVLENIQLIQPIYADVINGIFNPDTDPNIAKYKQEIQQLQMQFADKNENGEVIINKGKIQLTEKFADYEKDRKSVV